MTSSSTDTPRVHWHATPPSPAQVAAWQRLWCLLLDVPPPRPHLPEIYAGKEVPSIERERRAERECPD